MGGGPRVTAEDFDRVPCLDGARALKRDLLSALVDFHTGPRLGLRGRHRLRDLHPLRPDEKAELRALLRVLEGLNLDGVRRSLADATGFASEDDDGAFGSSASGSSFHGALDDAAASLMSHEGAADDERADAERRAPDAADIRAQIAARILQLTA